MSKFSVKTLLIIFLSLLIAIVVLWKFVLPKQKVKATWWNDSWHYRQAINISSHNSLESNVYIITTVNIGTTTKAQIDDGDFRFIDQSGQNLDYYIASGVGTTNLTFHIQFSSFPAGAQTIYVYYGNSSVTNGFSTSDFTIQATNYTIGSLSAEEAGGGPIAYWKFDEGVGTTAYDSTNNQNNGTISGATWSDESQCVSGKCLNFDGVDDYVSTGTGANYFPMQTFSICAWTKSPGLASGMNNNGIISLTYGLSMFINSSGQFGSNMDNGTNIINVTATSATLYDNKFHHLCLTYDGSNRKMYIDGVLKNSTATTWLGTTRWPTNGVNIGHENNNPAIYKFNGLIDEPKIYNYARTAAQIKQDYNSRGSSNGSSVNLGIKSNTSPSLKSSLVAYYKFDEGLGLTAHDSVGGHDAVLSGSTTPSWQNSDQCKSGKCLYFNGINSFVNAGTSPDLTPQSISIEAWVKPTSFVSSWMGIISNMTSWGTGFGLQLGTSQKIAAMINGTYLTTTWTPSLNRWYHIVATHNSSNNQNILYINGIKESISTQAISYESNAKTYIGVFYTSPSLFFNGSIDEVKIYNRALTDEEIKQDYNSGSAIQFGSANQTIGGTTTSLEYCIPGDTSFCASPVAEWKMDEKVGTTIVDSSGNNNTGTFGVGNSAPTWTQGKIGSALSFDGTNDTAIFPNINNSDNFTASMWIYPKSNNTFSFFEKRTGYDDGFFIFQSGGIINFDWGGSGTRWTTGIGTTLNQWSYITFIRNTAGRYVYINGKLAASTSNAGTTSNVSSNLNIGWAGYAGPYSINGLIDQVRIYNYARTPAQIAYDYNKGGPVGWWKMDECQGNTAYDWSGNNNNGTINIGASGTQTSVGTCTDNLSTSAWNNGKTGKTNSSLNFDGADDKITINDPGTNSSLDANGKNLTLSAWIKGNNFTSQYNAIIVKKTVAPYELWAYTNDLMCGFIIDGTSYRKTYNADFNIGTWYHTVCSYDGNTIKAYVNGVLRQSWTQNGTIITDSNNPLYLGWSGYSNEYFNGQIDDVRIYNYALTNEQVKTLYNGGAVSFN